MVQKSQESGPGQNTNVHGQLHMRPKSKKRLLPAECLEAPALFSLVHLPLKQFQARMNQTL